MLLTFYVHGRGRDEPEPMSWAKDAWGYVLMYGKQAGQYMGLVEEDPRTETPKAVRQVDVTPTPPVAESRGGGWMGKLFGGLSSMRSGDPAKTSQRGLPPPGTYKSGEVHGDYVKVSHSQAIKQQLSANVAECGRHFPVGVPHHRCARIDRLSSRSSCRLLVARGGQGESDR